MDYIIPFLVETVADPLTQSLEHRAVINQEHEEHLTHVHYVHKTHAKFVKISAIFLLNLH